MSSTGGIVVDGGPGQYWAWAALRLLPAAAVTGPPAPAVPVGRAHNVVEGYVGKLVQAGSVGAIHLHDHVGAPARDDRPWLRSLWELADATGAVVELRQVNNPGTARVDAYLVVRTESPDGWLAAEAAARLRHDLAATLPVHLATRPVVREDELLSVLVPCRPHPAGLAEIRKAVTAARSVRAGGPWLTAVTPWRGGGSWEPALAELAALGFRAAVSVAVMSYRVGPGLRRLLADRAAATATLATPGTSLTSVYGGPQPPDQFAVAAAPVVAAAVGRYTGAAFQVRVSLAAEGPLPPRFAAAVAGAISTGAPAAGIAGAPAVVVRPTAAELPVAWRNVTGLNFEPLPVAHCQDNPPEAIGEVERVLGAIADLDETAAAFRLPHPVSRG